MSDSEDSLEVPEVEYLLGFLDTLGLRDALRGGGVGWYSSSSVLSSLVSSCW